METEIEQLADSEFLGLPVAPPLPSRAHMLGTGLRAQPWRWQTGSRYQRLGAKATSCLGSPGRALDELQPPCLATLILPNSHGTNLLYRETTGRPQWPGLGVLDPEHQPHTSSALPQWPRAVQASDGDSLTTALGAEPGTWAGEDHTGWSECPQAFAYRAPRLGVPLRPPYTLYLAPMWSTRRGHTGWYGHTAVTPRP